MSLYLSSCILTVYFKVYIQIPTPSLSFLSLLFWPDIQAIIIKGQQSLLSQLLSRDLIQLKMRSVTIVLVTLFVGSLGLYRSAHSTSHEVKNLICGHSLVTLVTLFAGYLGFTAQQT
jgi:hypothetical protein